MSRRRYRAVMAALGLLTVGAFTAAVGWGAVSIAPAQVAAVFLNKAGIDPGIDVSPLQTTVLWSIRLPRVLMSLVVGAALAVSGAVLQGIFRNPLAEPSLLGISGGAVVGSMAATVVGTKLSQSGAAAKEIFTVWGAPLAGFFGALAVSFALYSFFRRGPRQDVTTFVLAGVIANVVLGALITLLPAVFRDGGLGSDASFWTMGSFGGTLWPYVHAAAPVFFVASGALWAMAPQLNLMALGDADAQYLGVDVHKVRLHAIVLVALVTGAAVAFAGVVAFVGLVVPHGLRLLIGPDHRRLLPAGALGGALTVCVADLLSRTVASPAELPVGVLTTLVGGPLFFWLLLRERTRGKLDAP